MNKPLHFDRTRRRVLAGTVDMKLEVVVIPVSDVDRAKLFYSDLGWRLDADFVVGDAFRGVHSRPQARRARSTSAKALHRPHLARRAGYILSYPTFSQPKLILPGVVSQ